MRFTEDFGLKVEEIKMEDGVIETLESESVVVRPPKIEVRAREEEGDKHEEEIDREKRQKVEGGGGFLDNLLAKLTSTKAPKSSDDQVFEVNNNTSDNDDARVRGSGDGGGDGENGGGCGGGDGDGGKGENGGGGVINNLISNFFHGSSEGEGKDVKNSNGSEESLECRNEENEMTNKVEKEGEVGNSTGGSLISSLVQDVAAPEADEASILIHSVVHD